MPLRLLPTLPTPLLWSLSCSTEGGESNIISFPEISSLKGLHRPHMSLPEEEPGRALSLTAGWLIIRAVAQVVLAGLCGGLLTGGAGDPGNGGQVPRRCFGHR